MIEWEKQKTGFTIVELLIVIVVIGILAAITIVAFSSVQQRANVAATQSAVQQALKKVEAQKVLDNGYPETLANAGIAGSSNLTYGYSRVESNTMACVWARQAGVTYSLQTGDNQPIIGECGQVIASFYRGTALTNPIVVRADAQINNNWGTASPHDGVPTDNFSAKFETRVVPPVSGDYILYTYTDDSAQLSVDGQTVIPMTASGVRFAETTAIPLTANVPVKIEYVMREGGGSAYARLEWSYPGVSRTIIPAENYLRP